jgi:signal transduction histidine kinase
MVAMIGDLLDLARLQTGAPPVLQRRPVDLIALTRQAAESMEIEPSAHHIDIETSEDTLVGIWDQRRIERVIANLLSNAVKYSPDGGIVEVRVSRRDDPECDETWAVLQVRDHGLGIPEADLPRIAEPFYRAGNVAHRIQGTGVGLAGSRQTVEQHGGRLTVESREGKGATFTVLLPLA